MTMSHGAPSTSGSSAFCRLLPQLGVGIWTPRPRYDSADSVRMLSPIASVAATMTGASAFGSR